VSVTWVTRQGWEGGRGVRLWDYLLHGERKGPTWPISVTLATGTSLREVAVLSSTYSGTDRSDIPSCSRLSCAPKPCRHVNGTV
jgi:hypothetical protein